NTPYFIALSPFSVKVLKPFIPDKAKIYFLENPHKVVEKKVDVTKNKKYVFVGRLSKEKNPVLLAKVAKKFGIEVLFVGDGEERQSIINNNPDAEITGWVDGDKVKEYLLTARALVMTSNWYEGQPLVVGEALGQGIPVVVPDTCAAIDVVQHGYNGLIFKSNNEASLYEALKLLESNSFLKELSNNAYKKFWSKPPIIDTHVNALINIYNEILKG
ncbi:glycosyltransferase family 4 protein, partial [Geobacillus zalihae]|uniref:glycosyltransferase family 4 protein n=1 Tax=Geobacillus zalihae TaxID=213419 RepID=UPI0009F0BD2C